MDINALKEKLANMNKKTSKADVWKPKDEHQVRLIQTKHSDDPLITLNFHNEVGDGPVLCIGEGCKFCEFADQLKSFNYPNGKKKPDNIKQTDWELFKKIQAKARVFSAMVERGHENEGGRWWGMTPAQCQQALDVCLDGDRLEDLGLNKDDTANAYKVLFDPDKGYDLAVSFAKPGEKGNQKTFTSVTVKGKIKSSALAKTKAEAQKLIDSVKPLKDTFPMPTREEHQKAFDRFVNSGAKEAQPEGGTEKYEKKPSNTKEDAKLSGTRSIDEAFGDLVDGDN